MIVRLAVLASVAVLVVGVARYRPAVRPAPLDVAGNLSGPGVFLFTSEVCDSCDAARRVYRDVLGDGGFVEYTWEEDAALLTRLGVEEIPVGSVVDRSGTEVAAFRLIPRRSALRRAARTLNR